MSTHLEATVQNVERDNDYFTSTIVGLPLEVAMGRAYTKRKLSQNPAISVDAITAEVWHSDEARALLKQHIKQSPKTLGLPFPAGSYARQQSKKSEVLAFFLGFCISAVVCLLCFYMSPSRIWLQKLLDF